MPARFLALLTTLLFTASATAEGIVLKVASNRQEAEHYEEWIAERPFNEIIEYRKPGTMRGTVDLILQLQALALGGIKVERVEFTVYPVITRAFTATSAGKTHLMTQTFWTSELATMKDQLHITAPVIKNGTFSKGIYAPAKNKEIFKVTTLSELKRFSPIVVSSWENDIYTLKSVPFDKITQAASSETAFKMLDSGRADFILFDFSSSPDLSHTIGGVTLKPVPNLKFSVVGSRAYCISKILDHDGKLYRAMEKGLRILEKEGRIQRAYEEIGFYNPQVADWERIF